MTFVTCRRATLNKGEALSQSVTGARLTSVQFVLDSLILGLDGKGALTTVVLPEIYIGSAIGRFEMNGYRDSLCPLISQVVSSAEITEQETIFGTFEDLRRVRIPLRDCKA